MSLPPGSRVGSYEIIVSIGAGGMGEVYRARDAKLGRDVAIKILPGNVAADPDRLARFEREARSLAALNHPNIAQVYGFDDGAIVMELLEGETLRDRLRGGALPIRKAIDYAAQMARGLAAAHDRGIMHRDLKPENVILLADGQVKLLDFGLARPAAAAPSSGATETLAAGGTDPGTVLGTVGYMSPEQIRAEAIDHRSDLFSLGAVLYEMLSGERAFRRTTNAETMTAILREDPGELSSMRADVSPAIDRIVRHALEKNPVERFQSARDIAFALEALSGSASAAVLPAAARARFSLERVVWATLTLVLLGVLLWQWRTPQAASAPPMSYQLNLALPDEIRSNEFLAPTSRMGLSNDGMQLAYSGVDTTGAEHLWVILLRTGAVRDVAGATGALSPVWSPDGSEIVYSVRMAGSVATRRIAATGGATEAVASFGAPKIWGSTGVLLFSGPGPGVRWRDPESGALHSYDPETGLLRAHAFLPDGRHFLVSELTDRFTPIATSIASLDSTERVRIIDGAAPAFYAPGAIAYVRPPALMAQRFDERGLALVGQPVTITEGIEFSVAGGYAITSSRSGTLVLQRPDPPGRWQLQWFRRDGTMLSTVSQPADYSNAELSPDGSRLLASLTDPTTRTRDIFILDLERGVRQRLTFDPVDERSAVWSPDGQRVYYRSIHTDLYVRRADFTGDATAIVADGNSKDPYAVSRDGKYLAYRVTGPSGTNDVMLAPLDPPGAPIALRATGFDESGGSFSPDGRSIAYQSDESGHPEIYVTATDGNGKVQLSNGGGRLPRWVRNGTEILYVSTSRMLMSVAVKGSGATFQAGVPRPLFHVDVPQGAGVPYDVTADGQRIIVINSADGGAARPLLTAIINWPALIGR